MFKQKNNQASQAGWCAAALVAWVIFNRFQTEMHLSMLTLSFTMMAGAAITGYGVVYYLWRFAFFAHPPVSANKIILRAVGIGTLAAILLSFINIFFYHLIMFVLENAIITQHQSFLKSLWSEFIIALNRALKLSAGQIPLGVFSAILFRWIQVRLSSSQSKKNLPQRSLSATEIAKKIVQNIAIFMVALFWIFLVYLAYLIATQQLPSLDEQSRFYSVSPSKEKLFSIFESCWWDCQQKVTVTIKENSWKTYSEPCRLEDGHPNNINFKPGTTLQWNSDETAFIWKAPHLRFSKTFSLRNHCGYETKTASPLKNHRLYFHETCLFEPCRRSITLGIDGTPGRYTCSANIALDQYLFTGPRSDIEFQWNADDTQLAWKSQRLDQQGTIHLAECINRLLKFY